MVGTQYSTRTGDTSPIPIVGASSPTSTGGGMPPGRPSGAWRPYLLRGAGLLAIAVVSSLLWWAVRADAVGGAVGDPHPTAAQGPLTSGQFDYQRVMGPVVTSNCAEHSYGRIQNWFTEHPCRRLARGLYTTRVHGQRALVSVSLVTMPSPESARRLHELAFTSGTGNVSDLAREGMANLTDPPVVARGEYKSKLAGPRVTIVEANFFGEYTNESLLVDIASDARHLSVLLRE